MVSTVNEQSQQYSKREIDRAIGARELMRRTNYPADGSLMRTLNTSANIKAATDIYGKDVASIQGKSKDMGTLPDDRVYVPTAERKEQVIYADIFLWRNETFVIFIAKPLRIVMTQHVTKQNTESMKVAVENLCNIIIGKGFNVKEIVTDPARELAALQGHIPYNINTVGSRTHVADAEVEMRVIKEPLRCSTIGVPFNVPRRIIKWQVYGCIKAYNIVLRPGQSVSAKESFTGIKPNYKREYVQAHVV